MDDDLTPEEEARLAELEAKYAPTPAPEQGYGESFASGVQNYEPPSMQGIMDGAKAMFKGAGDFAGDVARNYTISPFRGSMMGIPQAIGAAAYENLGVTGMGRVGVQGAVGAALPVAAPVTVPLAGYAYDKAGQALDLFPSTTGAEDAKSLINEYGGTLLTAGAAKLGGTVLKTGENIVAPGKQNAWLASQNEGALAATLGANRNLTMREAEMARQVRAQESVMRDLNPAEGIKTNTIQARAEAFPQFQQKITAIKERAIGEKASILTQADTAVGKQFVLTADEIELAGIQRGLSQEAIDMAKQKAAQDFNYLEPYNVATAGTRPYKLVNNKPFVEGQKALSPSEAQGYLTQNIDQNLKASGAYDDGAMARANLDPSQRAKLKDTHDSLFLLRDVAQEKLHSLVDKVPGGKLAIEKANEQISAMREFEKLAERFQAENSGAIAPGAPKSLNKTVTEASATGVTDTATDGLVSETGARQGTRKDLQRGGRAVQQFNDIVGYQRGTKFAPTMAEDIAPTFGQGAMMAPVLLPRDTEKLVTQERAALGRIATAVGLLASPDDLNNKSRQEVKQIAQSAMNLIPEAFEKTPDEYKFIQDGKFLDPMERQQYVMEAVDKGLSPSERYKVIGGALSKNRYTPIREAQEQGQFKVPDFNLDDYGSALDIPMSQGNDGMFESDSSRALDHLDRSMSLIDVEKSGL